MEYQQPTWQLSGMTCSFADPESVKATWAFEACKLIREFHVLRADLEIQMKKPALMKLSRKRLEQLLPLVQEQISCLEKLLEPLGWKKVHEQNLIGYLTQSPAGSFLASNYENLFRDWVWGEIENKAALSRIQSTLDPKLKFENVLVLGSGAGRLAYDLHLSMKPKQTVVCDFNPLLMLAAQKVIGGGSLSLVEFPLMPSQGDLFALKHDLRAPSALSAADGFEFVLADATQSTFADASFSTVVTPWLIDVVQTDLADFLAVINQILPVGGTWISFGPLGFNNPMLASHYSLEEVKYLIQKSGFEVTGESYEMIPYMHNPSSNSHRSERVLTLTATKTKDIGRPEVSYGDQDFMWETDKDAPIEIPIEQLNLVRGHQINAEVLSMVQAGSSFNQIVASLAAKHSLPEDNAAQLASHILYNAEAATHRNPLRR